MFNHPAQRLISYCSMVMSLANTHLAIQGRQLRRIAGISDDPESFISCVIWRWGNIFDWHDVVEARLKLYEGDIVIGGSGEVPCSRSCNQSTMTFFNTFGSIMDRVSVLIADVCANRHCSAIRTIGDIMPCSKHNIRMDWPACSRRSLQILSQIFPS